MLVEFSLELLYSTMCGENFQIYGAHIPRKCIDSRHFYSCPPPTQNSPLNFLSSRPKEKSVPPTAEMGGRNYDLLYQNSVRKYKDDLED